MGVCNNSSVAQLVESRTQKAKCMGSNHGVDNRLVDLAMKKILIFRVAAVRCRSSTQNRGRTGKMVKGSEGSESEKKIKDFLVCFKLEWITSSKPHWTFFT